MIADDGTRVPVLRIPSGRALRGFDEADDGHLETPWTGEPVEVDTGSFEVVLDRYTPGSAAGQ